MVDNTRKDKASRRWAYLRFFLLGLLASQLVEFAKSTNRASDTVAGVGVVATTSIVHRDDSNTSYRGVRMLNEGGNDDGGGNDEDFDEESYSSKLEHIEEDVSN